MKRSDLRRRVSMRLADLEPILEELAKEGHIRISGGFRKTNQSKCLYTINIIIFDV